MEGGEIPLRPPAELLGYRVLAHDLKIAPRESCNRVVVLVEELDGKHSPAGVGIHPQVSLIAQGDRAELDDAFRVVRVQGSESVEP